MRTATIVALAMLSFGSLLPAEEAAPEPAVSLSCEDQTSLLRAATKALQAQLEAQQATIRALRGIIAAGDLERRVAAEASQKTAEPIAAFEAEKARILNSLGKPSTCNINLDGSVACPESPDPTKP